MSQGFILGPLLFNIFISDPFLFIENTLPLNYADINTMYYLEKPPNIVINRLRHDFAKILEWFYENYIFLTQITAVLRLSVLMSSFQIFLLTIMLARKMLQRKKLF